MSHGNIKKLEVCPQTSGVYHRIKTEFGDFFPKSAFFIEMSNHFAALNSGGKTCDTS